MGIMNHKVNPKKVSIQSKENCSPCAYAKKFSLVSRFTSWL